MNTFFVARRMCYVFLVLIISSNIILAQDKEEHKGLYALQFQIGQNFSLSSFQGSVLSGKYNFTENDAVRLGISINANKNDMNSFMSQSNPDANFSSVMSNVSNTYGLIIQYLRNNYLRNNFNFYYGGGPSFTYGVNRNNDYSPQGGSYQVRNEYKRYYGITAFAGIEWYFSEYMSLSAQYGIGYNYYEDITSASNGFNGVQQNSTENKDRGFQVIPNSVLFGLSVYF